LRQFAPADQRTVGNIDGLDLLPVVGVLAGAGQQKPAFRNRYRDLFGAVSTKRCIYIKFDLGRAPDWRMALALPLLEERLAHFDYLED